MSHGSFSEGVNVSYLGGGGGGGGKLKLEGEGEEGGSLEDLLRINAGLSRLLGSAMGARH